MPAAAFCGDVSDAPIAPEIRVEIGAIYVNDFDMDDNGEYDMNQAPLTVPSPGIVPGKIVVTPASGTNAYLGTGKVVVAGAARVRLWKDALKHEPFTGKENVSASGETIVFFAEGLGHSQDPRDTSITVTWMTGKTSGKPTDVGGADAKKSRDAATPTPHPSQPPASLPLKPAATPASQSSATPARSSSQGLNQGARAATAVWGRPRLSFPKE